MVNFRTNAGSTPGRKAPEDTTPRISHRKGSATEKRGSTRNLFLTSFTNGIMQASKSSSTIHKSKRASSPGKTTKGSNVAASSSSSSTKRTFSGPVEEKKEDNVIGEDDLTLPLGQNNANNNINRNYRLSSSDEATTPQSLTRRSSRSYKSSLTSTTASSSSKTSPVSSSAARSNSTSASSSGGRLVRDGKSPYTSSSPMARMRSSEIQRQGSNDSEEIDLYGHNEWSFENSSPSSPGKTKKKKTTYKTPEEVKAEKQKKWKRQMKLAQEKKRQERRVLEGKSNKGSKSKHHETTEKGFMDMVFSQVEQNQIFMIIQKQCGAIEDTGSNSESEDDSIVARVHGDGESSGDESSGPEDDDDDDDDEDDDEEYESAGSTTYPSPERTKHKGRNRRSRHRRQHSESDDDGAAGDDDLRLEEEHDDKPGRKRGDDDERNEKLLIGNARGLSQTAAGTQHPKQQEGQQQEEGEKVFEQQYQNVMITVQDTSNSNNKNNNNMSPLKFTPQRPSRSVSNENKNAVTPTNDKNNDTKGATPGRRKSPGKQQQGQSPESLGSLVSPEPKTPASTRTDEGHWSPQKYNIDDETNIDLVFPNLSPIKKVKSPPSTPSPTRRHLAPPPPPPPPLPAPGGSGIGSGQSELSSNIWSTSTLLTDFTSVSSSASVNPNDKAFVKAFIQDILSIGCPMLWHTERVSMNPAKVILRLIPGYRTSTGVHCGPRLIWSEQQQQPKDKKSTENDHSKNHHHLHQKQDINSIDLFDIHSLDRANPIQLGDYPFAIPGRSIFITLTRGRKYVFEARSERDTTRFVHGMKWIIARQAFNLVIGNMDVSCELLDIGIKEKKNAAKTHSPSRSVFAEAEWVKAMDDLADELVEKSLQRR